MKCLKIGVFVIKISSMRKNETYVAISKWTRLIILGLMPFAVILHFNLRVYLKLRQNKLGRKRIYSFATIEVRVHR